ncbi:CRISPR-associated endoribonuclease Cas6 [Xanthovirga aplysinae]|uniref:CRISPR-associated endoribonuclease Cas6 n=1 Tax=Xanthovirga aplysinae TaxID=2529853 RepID=UPI0012BD219E|nr:CRISPR-associated endoribonuclease Cas6 [Xanthovirga aplysinae]MTI31981.1 CRISPR-associated endoribonuclease Cas6 [Xanthovirga aplysinae]
MRVRIIFNLKNRGAYVPFHHQFLLAQLIKGVLLKEADSPYRNFNKYIFSALKGQTKVSRNGLHYYSSKVTLVLSSPDQKFINFFLKNLFSYKQVEVGGLLLQPDGVEKEAAPNLTTVSKFICISPIVLLTPTFNDGNAKRFISPETDSFSDLLYESTMMRMGEYGYTTEQLESFYKFQVVPDKNYLSKIKTNQKKFARIYPVYNQDVKYEVRGYTFPFTLYAAKEVQEFVFTCGLSSFTHKGFGMLDLANSDPAKRTIEYNFN